MAFAVSASENWLIRVKYPELKRLAGNPRIMKGGNKHDDRPNRGYVNEN